MKDYCKILNEIIESYYDNEYPEYFEDDVSKIFEREGITAEYKVEPIKHGRWIKWEGDVLTCSNCKHYWIQSGDQYDFKYCPYCGARMDEADHER